MNTKLFLHVRDGEWVQPILRGHLMKCCDCGLVHRMDFRLVNVHGRARPQFRAKRLSAAAGRRAFALPKEAPNDR